jgi:toxin ParE1/3/4
VKAKAVVPREQANQDIDEAIAYYLKEGAETAALGFIDEVETAYIYISRNPGTGSARYAHALDLPGLRFLPLTRFPHLVFYFEQSDCIDVWRVLHGHRDIPAWMQASEPGS